MNNLENPWTTHKDVKKMLKRKVDWFAVIFFTFVLFLLFLFFIGKLDNLKEKDITNIQISTALINGQETVIYTRNGQRTARVQYEKCGDIATIDGFVKHCEREIISVELD